MPSKKDQEISEIDISDMINRLKTNSDYLP